VAIQKGGEFVKIHSSEFGSSVLFSSQDASKQKVEILKIETNFFILVLEGKSLVKIEHFVLVFNFEQRRRSLSVFDSSEEMVEAQNTNSGRVFSHRFEN
jgi:hypothetical protein